MKLLKIVLALFIASALSGCLGLTRSVVNLEVDTVANPTTHKVVVLEDVTDKREFRVAAVGEGSGASLTRAFLTGLYTAKPRHGNLPSVETYEDFKNPNIRARAIGRYHGGYGNPFGNILLPEGMTVAGIVRTVLQTALREAGYRVVKKDDPSSKGAPVYSAEVENYWAWSTGDAIQFQASIKLGGDWPSDGRRSKFHSSVSESSLLFTDDSWQSTIKKGNARLREELKFALKRIKQQ